jgi:hypothetical protein
MMQTHPRTGRPYSEGQFSAVSVEMLLGLADAVLPMEAIPRWDAEQASGTVFDVVAGERR